MDDEVGLTRNTLHDPCTMMTMLASVVVVAQSLEQGPQSSFLTRLVGKVVAVVVELCVLWSRCAVRTYLFQDTFCISALYQPLCHALQTNSVNSAEERLTRLCVSRQRRIPARLCTGSRLLDELHAVVQVGMLRTRLWHEGPSWRRSVLRVIRVGRVVWEVHSQNEVFNFFFF